MNGYECDGTDQSMPGLYTRNPKTCNNCKNVCNIHQKDVIHS